MLESTVRLAGPAFVSGWRSTGLAALAGLFLGAAGALPAAAQTGPNPACNYTAAPQGYGDSMRYSNCMHQLDCQRLANAAGKTIYQAGCFGVAPDTQAAPSASKPHRR